MAKNTNTDIIEKEYTTLNLGPTHPATHGIFQNVLKMDGEIIIEGESTVGYIHRAFEKIAEHRPYYQITILTDRDRKSTRLNSSHIQKSRMPSSA